MLKRFTGALVAGSVVFALALAAGPAGAGDYRHDRRYAERHHGHWDDDDHRKFRKFRKWHRRDHRRWHRRHHGPPDWAPAHGYRHKKWHREPRHDREVYRPAVERHGRPYRPVGDYASDRGLIGGLIGATVGAVLGSHIGKGDGRTAAIVGGGVLGAIVGGSIGQSMDRSDRVHTAQVLETSHTGRTVTWRNPDTGTRYGVTPTRTYKTREDRYCREFSSWAVIGGYEERVHGTACRMPDGSWKRVI